MKKLVLSLILFLILVNSVIFVVAENNDNNKEFCGSSSKGYCEVNSDCKKGGCSGQVCENISESTITICDAKECYFAENYNKKCSCTNNKCQWIDDFQCNSEQDCIDIGKCSEQLECTCRTNKCYSGYVAECDTNNDCNSGKKCENNRCVKKNFNNLTKEQIKELIQEKNRIKFENKTGQKCPEDCECQGVVVKCELDDGTRQMTVYAQSGNIIIITKEVNASTKVELYKVNGTLWGKFKNNETKQIKMTPKQVQEKIKEKIKAKMEKLNITLDEDGFYIIQMNKKTRLFFLFPVREKIEARINVENGEVVKIKNPWWGFFAKDEKSEQILGADCGAVSPDNVDECCENKGYDYWNSEKQECGFE